jgi:hypothetical protein
MEFLAGAAFVGLGYYISLYLIIRLNYFPTTTKSGFIKLTIVIILCSLQGSCNFMMANFIEKDYTLEGLNYQALVYFSVLVVLAFIKVKNHPDLKVKNWQKRLFITLLSSFLFMLSLAYFFS